MSSEPNHPLLQEYENLRKRAQRLESRKNNLVESRKNNLVDTDLREVSGKIQEIEGKLKNWNKPKNWISKPNLQEETAYLKDIKRNNNYKESIDELIIEINDLEEKIKKELSKSPVPESPSNPNNNKKFYKKFTIPAVFSIAVSAYGYFLIMTELEWGLLFNLIFSIAIASFGSFFVVAKATQLVLHKHKINKQQIPFWWIQLAVLFVLWFFFSAGGGVNTLTSIALTTQLKQGEFGEVREAYITSLNKAKQVVIQASSMNNPDLAKIESVWRNIESEIIDNNGVGGRTKGLVDQINDLLESTVITIDPRWIGPSRQELNYNAIITTMKKRLYNDLKTRSLYAPILTLREKMNMIEEKNNETQQINTYQTTGDDLIASAQNVT